MFPDDADTQLVKEAMWDPFEYFVSRNRDGLLKKDFQQPLGKVSYHVPCHSRVQNIGKKSAGDAANGAGHGAQCGRTLFGHAGTFGVKKEFHATR